ncbi:hypothetical protein C2G38_2155472 [Gigaspora rosea]|uniref:HMG box domain-containing protein n=1 Tax=Gigaspora rosea TaxID=44941 RepID=A0A397WA58_9GLOM|nr:hypothetical protein C2G38_2155472 [Gigaspora rosea]
MSNSSPSEFRRLPISQQDIDLTKEPREINELVNELKLNYGDVQTTKRIDNLWNSSVNTRAKTIPRPQNCFILFRNDISAEYNQQKNDNKSKKRAGINVLSKIAKERWTTIKNFNQHEYQFWKKLTVIAILKHKLLYPNYKYFPIKKKKQKTSSISSS